MRYLVILMFLVVLMLALAAPAFAQAQAPAGEYPNVAGMTAFSAETNFMSLPGYLRWITWRDQQVWLTREEATRIVAAQQGG